MKIAFVFDNMIYGGIERVGINHIRLLKELGHEVEAYVLTPKTEPIVDELKAICPVTFINLPRKNCPEAYWIVTRRVRGGKYLFPLAYIAVSAKYQIERLFKKSNKQYDIAIAFSGHYNDLSFVADGFVDAKKKIAWLHGALYQYVINSQGFENLYKKIKNLVVLVEDAQEEVLAYHKSDGFDFNIHKIYNSMNAASYNYNEQKVESLKKQYGEFIVMVSRLSYPHKDHYTVIQAIKILKEKYGMSNKLLLVGDGPEREKLESLVRESNLEEQVVFLGSHSDVENYYKASKILAHASVAGEGLPTVLLEAMGIGIPVVCTDSKVGPREILGDSKYGLLTAVKDPKDMAEKLYLLLTDDAKYTHYIKAGKERIKDFSEESVKAQLQKLLTELV